MKVYYMVHNYRYKSRAALRQYSYSQQEKTWLEECISNYKSIYNYNESVHCHASLHLLFCLTNIIELPLTLWTINYSASYKLAYYWERQIAVGITILHFTAFLLGAYCIFMPSFRVCNFSNWKMIYIFETYLLATKMQTKLHFIFTDLIIIFWCNLLASLGS